MLSQQLSHIKITKEKLKDKEFLIAWFALTGGFLLMILGFCMCGINGYLFIVPKLVPSLAVLTGLNSMVYGYIYQKEEISWKEKHSMTTLVWEIFHFVTLLISSFLNVLLQGPQWSVVLSWLMMGCTLMALFNQMRKQIKRKSLVGIYLYFNLWLGFHTFVQVIWANLSPVHAGKVGGIQFFASIFLLLPKLYFSQRQLLMKAKPVDQQEDLHNMSARKSLGPNQMNDLDAYEEEIDNQFEDIESKRVFLQKSIALNSALMVQAMDNQTNPKERADQILRAIELIENALKSSNVNDPSGINQNQEICQEWVFIEKEEKCWKLFLECGNDLDLCDRQLIIEQIDQLASNETFNQYCQCYSSLHAGSLRYTQILALLQQHRVEEAFHLITQAIEFIQLTKQRLEQNKPPKLRRRTFHVISKYAKNLEERLIAQQTEFATYQQEHGVEFSPEPVVNGDYSPSKLPFASKNPGQRRYFDSLSPGRSTQENSFQLLATPNIMPQSHEKQHEVNHPMEQIEEYGAEYGNEYYDENDDEEVIKQFEKEVMLNEGENGFEKQASALLLKINKAESRNVGLEIDISSIQGEKPINSPVNAQE